MGSMSNENLVILNPRKPKKAVRKDITDTMGIFAL